METISIGLIIMVITTPFADLDGLTGTDDQHQLAAEIAVAYELDSLLVWAVIQAESAWNPKARSVENCLGLMQIYPKYHGGLPDSLYLQEELNLNLGCAYLSKLLKMFDGNLEQALTAYNYGPHHLVTLNRRTSGYALRVLDLYNRWRIE